MLCVAGFAGEEVGGGEGRDCEAKGEEGVAMCGEGWIVGSE